MFAHVIAGIDGTDGGLDAVALARLLGAQRLTLVGAYPGDPLPGWDGPAVDDEPVRDAVLDDLEEARLAAGITTELWPAADPSPAGAAARRRGHARRPDLRRLLATRRPGPDPARRRRTVPARRRSVLGGRRPPRLGRARCRAPARRGRLHGHARIRQGAGARRRLGARPRRPPQRRDRLGGAAPDPRARPLAGLRGGLPPGRPVGDGPRA